MCGSFPLRCPGCWLNGVPTQQAVATMFLGDRLALNASATAAGYLGELPQDFIMSGQSAGGGFAAAVGGYYAADPTNSGSLRGVVMFDGFAFARGRVGCPGEPERPLHPGLSGRGTAPTVESQRGHHR